VVVGLAEVPVLGELDEPVREAEDDDPEMGAIEITDTMSILCAHTHGRWS